MAEIILPPEEETPQVPELNIDKPTENSKVITIEFEAKKTNKVSTKDTNQQLYTTDTDAWFEFKETSLEGANGTYSVVFRNRHDGSIFQRTGDVVNGVAYYKIPHQEIRHAGAWRGQIVYTLRNGDTTSREFGYDVKGHILDGKDVREIVVEDFETLMSQLRNMKDNAEQELANLVNTTNQNETNRQAFFVDLVEDIDELQANYQELLDMGVLQTNINEKLEALEEEYAPKLTEVTAQLGQTENNISALESDKADKAEVEAANTRVDNLIVESGNADAEVTDAHISTPRNETFETISKRFEQVELEMIENVLLNATNLVENGNFKDGTTGWSSSADLTTSDNTLNVHRATAGTSADISATYTFPKFRETGHIYYYRADIKTDNHATTRGLHLRLWAPGHTIMYDDPIPGSFQTLSAIIPGKEEYRNDRRFTVGARYQTSQATENTNTQIKNVLVIDLTATFGIGNEPDKELIDFIIGRYYDIYFDGTKSLLSLEKTAVVNYESERVLNELLNEGFLNGKDCEIEVLEGLNIQVNSGELYKNLTTLEVPEKTFEIATPDSTYTRHDIIAVDHKGELQIIEGSPKQWREPPLINDDYQKVAEIRVPANANSIKSSDIEDLRTFSKVNLLSSKVATVIVAASNSSHYDKSIADYVCDGQNDEVEIQKALDRFIYRSGKVMLANGDYYIDSLYDTGSSFSGKFGVVIKKPEIQREVVIEGANAPIRMLDRTNILSGKNSPVLHLRKALYDTLATDELVTLVGVLPYNLDTGAIRYPAISFNIYKLGIQIPDNKKTIRCIDLYYASMAKTEDVLIMSEVHDGHNIATEGIRGLRGHNFGTGYSMKNMFMWGMGIGYNISGEHLIMENCGVRYSLYPFAFGLTPEQYRNGHPITLINCTHESCVNGPIFGDNPNKQFITFIDYNMEHGGMVQGAKELVPGAFTGSINYGIVGYPGQHDYINVDYPFWEDDGSGENFKTVNVAHKFSGTTSERPVHPNLNQQYYDTTLNKMIFYIENAWKDAMGNSV